MKLRAIRGFVVGPGKYLRENDIFEAAEAEAARYIARGYAVAAVVEAEVSGQPPEAAAAIIETRDPKPQTRDPRRGRNRRT